MACPERVDTIVVGGGQAGLAVGYHLTRRGLPFVILDASDRVGDAWRNRWDSLRLFSTRRYSQLDGMALPGPPHGFPTKDEIADYLEAYAKTFALPVRSGVRVDTLTHDGTHFLLRAGGGRIRGTQRRRCHVDRPGAIDAAVRVGAQSGDHPDALGPVPQPVAAPRRCGARRRRRQLRW